MHLPVVLVVFEICQVFEARYQCDADLRPFVAVLGHLFVYCRCLSSTLFVGQILLVVYSNNHLASFAILPVSIKTKNMFNLFCLHNSLPSIWREYSNTKCLLKSTIFDRTLAF